MLDVSTTVTIAAPRDRVAAYAADAANAANWYAHVQSGRWLTPGSAFVLVGRVPPGRTVQFTQDVAEAVPECRLVYRIGSAPVSIETTYAWSAVDGDRTEMTLHNGAQPRGLARLVVSLVAGAMRRSNGADLLRLKSILEFDHG